MILPHRSATGSSRPHAARAAFTLLEILLSLGLSLLLMAAIYSALDLHWRFSTAGREEVERAQMARALLVRIARAIRPAAWQKPDAWTEGNQVLSPGDMTDPTERTMVLRPTNSEAIPTPGVFGDSRTLVLRLGGTIFPGQGQASGDLSVNSCAGSLPSLRYSLGERGSGLQETLAGRSEPGMGMFGGSLSVAPAAPGSSAPRTRILATEVVLLQFRYFGHGQWLSAWDSIAMHGLPQAIEITLGLTPSAEHRTAPASSWGNSSAEMYRLVVPLPLADPYAMDTPFQQKDSRIR